MKKVCIVGSGPAAFYTAQYLLKHSNDVLVHLLEKLPVAHGLVRYGVAPDHQDVKNVENKFLHTIGSERYVIIISAEASQYWKRLSSLGFLRSEVFL